MADPENFTLSSLDEYRRVSNDSNDEEKGLETTPSPAQAEKIENPSNNGFHLLVWMTLNTFATIGIVFANKALFNDPAFKTTNAQITFAAFHFTLTSFILYTLSKPRFAMFEAQRAPVMKTLPLVAAMCLNVILPNLSLAFCSVILYQIARILLTPSVAAINFFLYHTTIPRAAGYALIPLCAGVGIVSYYDAIASVGADAKSTTIAGVFFAFSGVVASSFYTVWIGVYHKRLQMNSMQLLFNQTPLAVLFLSYAIPLTYPFTTPHPDWVNLVQKKWVLILLSGICACIINLSQFFIVNGAGPVSSTVVGHIKTCSIVALGWVVGCKSVGDRSIFGIILALFGIISYTIVMLRAKK